MKPWLSIVGIGDDGLSGLSAKAIEVINQSEIVVAGERHLSFLTNSQAEKISWDSPLNKTIELIKNKQGRQVTVLATGNPLWFGIVFNIVKASSNRRSEHYSASIHFFIGSR